MMDWDDAYMQALDLVQDKEALAAAKAVKE